MSSPFSDMQCPFNWEEVCEHLLEKDWAAYLNRKLARPHCSEWSVYCYKLFLGFVYGNLKSEKDALEEFKSCEEFVNEKSHEMFFMDILPGMKYMIDASKCVLYFNKGKRSLAMDMATSMNKFQDLSNESQASVWTAKALILNEFGYDEWIKAVECVKLAIEIDPNEDGSRRGAWYYLAGKIKGRIRRTRSGDLVPCLEELEYLEMSVAKNPFAAHYAMLAQAYRESAKILMKKHKNISLANKLFNQSMKAIMNALDEPNLSSSVLCRCALTLLKLPRSIPPITLIEETLKKANELEPNNDRVYLYLGDLEIWRKNNPEGALAYFEKAYLNGSDVVGWKIIEIKYKLDHSYNPLEDIDRYIARLAETVPFAQAQKRTVSYLVVKGDYHFWVRNDIVAAAREWEKAFDIDPDARSIQEFYSSFRIHMKPFNLYKVLQREISKALVSSGLAESDAEYLRGLLRKYRGYFY